MTDPTRPTDAELEAGHTRLPTEEAADLRARFLSSYPELAAYHESTRESTPKDGFAWMATQVAKPLRALTVEELQRSHDIAAVDRYLAEAVQRATVRVQWSFVQAWPDLGVLARLGQTGSSAMPRQHPILAILGRAGEVE